MSNIASYDSSKHEETRAGRVPQIPDQLKILDSKLNDLEGIVNMLEERLGFILRTEEPREENLPEDTKEMVPLAHNIHISTLKVNEAIVKIDSICSRLEI